jgi:sodium transport system permease protein
MSRKFIVVMRKELKEAVRDRRALGMLLLLIVLYPALLWFSMHKIIERANQADNETMEVVVIGGAQVPALVRQLEQRNVVISMRDWMEEAEITALLRDGRHAGVIRVPASFAARYDAMRPAPVELWYDSAADQVQLRRLEQVLRNYNASIASARLLAHGVSPAVLAPVQLQVYDIASSASRSARIAGTMIGLFFATAFFFAMNTAMDATAGERERRSLEALLAQPAHPLDLIAGKWLAAALIAVIGLTVELNAAHFLLKWMPLEEIGMSWRMSYPMLLAVCAVSIPLCLFAAAFEIALAMNARSFKEAQAIMGFVLLLPMLPALLVPMLHPTTAMWMYLVPVLSNHTLLGELAKGQDIGILPFLLTAGSPLLLALLAVAFASWRLKSERYVLGV